MKLAPKFAWTVGVIRILRRPGKFAKIGVGGCAALLSSILQPQQDPAIHGAGWTILWCGRTLTIGLPTPRDGLLTDVQSLISPPNIKLRCLQCNDKDQ